MDSRTGNTQYTCIWHLILAALALGGCATTPDSADVPLQDGSWQQVHEWQLDESVRDVAISADGRTVLLSSINQIDATGIQRLDTSTGEKTTILPTATAPRSLALSPDGETIAGSWPGAVGLISASGELLQEIPHVFGPQNRAFSDIEFTPDGRNIVGAAETVAWVSIELGDFVHEREVPSMSSRNLAVLNSDIVVVEQSTEIRLIHVNEEDPRCRIDVVHPGDVAVSPDGKQFATARYNAGFLVWNVEDCSLASEWHADGYTPSIAWLPDNRHLVTGSNSGAIKFWDTKSGELTHSLDAHGDGVVLIALSRDARALVSIRQGENATAKFWRRD